VKEGVSSFDSPAWVPEGGFPDLLKETSTKKPEWRRKMRFSREKRENNFAVADPFGQKLINQFLEALQL
jgi:hypothetical protein